MNKLLLVFVALILVIPGAAAVTEVLIWNGQPDSAYTGVYTGNEDTTHTGACVAVFNYNSSFANITKIGLYNSVPRTSGSLRYFLSYVKSDGTPFTTLANDSYMDYNDDGSYGGGAGWVNYSIPGGLQVPSSVSKFAIGYSSPSTTSVADCFVDNIGAYTKGFGYRRSDWGPNGGMTDNQRLALKIWVQDTGAPPVTFPWIKINVTDRYDLAAIAGANVTLHDGTSNLTNAAGIAVFNHSGNTGYNITDYAQDRYFTYYSTVNATENATTWVNVTGAHPEILAYDIEGNALTTYNITSPETFNSTAAGSLHLLLPPNATTSVTGAAPGFLSVTQDIVTTGQDAGTYNLSGFYTANLSIFAENAYTGVTITNFSGWAYHNETAYNVSFTDTNGTASLPVIGGNYTIYLDAFGYSVSSENYAYELVTADKNVTFQLYSENSVRFFVYDENTNLLINTSTTIIKITGNGTYQEETTTNGTLYVVGLLDGNYSVEFANANYTARTYTVTVADRSSQQLNAYLSPAGNTVVFTILDDDNAQTIEGVSVQLERLINGTYVTVETKISDITGRVQISYTPSVKYRFTVTHPDYKTKVFELDPVIFSSYTIRLDRVLAIDEELGLFDVTITYYTDHYPQWFLNDNNTTFTITFGSANGSLESYGFLVTYPGGSNSSTGANAIGGTFLATLEITGAASTDRVNLTYWYNSVFGENKTYSRSFYIDGAADSGTLFKARTTDFGLGSLEKILIAVITIILVAGLLTLVGSPVFGIMAGLLTAGFFVYIGFLSIWVAAPTFFVGLLLFMRRSSE